MEPVNGYELFGKIKRRTKVVDATVYVRFHCFLNRRCLDPWQTRNTMPPLCSRLTIWLFDHDFLEGLFYKRMLADQTAPVGVHGKVNRFIIEKLRGPFDGMDLGNFRRDNQPGDFKQLIRRDISIFNGGGGVCGVAQAGVVFRSCRSLLSKRIDEHIVLARKDVVEKAQTDGPIVRERHGLLAGPLRVHGIGGL